MKWDYSESDHFLQKNYTTKNNFRMSQNIKSHGITSTEYLFKQNGLDVQPA